MEWTTACPDWESRVLGARSLIPFPPLFPGEAALARQIFDDLKIVDAPGSPRIGDVGRQWLFDFTDAIFGSYDAESGRRLIREFLLLISKKNSKSTGAAAIMLTALIRNWRLSAEYLVLAPTIEIAQNCFFPARDMVLADPELKALCHIQEHYRTITYRPTKATLKVVAADNETVGGKKAVGVLVDELWLFGKRANAEGMLREATGGLASRPEGFVIYLSTQSDDPPAGIFRQKLQYARGVRDGRIQDKRFLPVLYEFPDSVAKEGGFRDKANFYITNPNLGASVDVEFLEREFDKAKDAGEASLCGFFAKHLNVEIGLTLRSDRWLGADHWVASVEPSLTLDSILERSETIVAGIDGGGLDDLLGLAVMGRDSVSKDWLLWTHAWAHKGVLDRRKEIAPALLGFANDGDLTIVDRPGEDVIAVADIISRISEAGLLPSKNGIGVDQVGISDIVDAVIDRGIAADCIVGVGQGWKLNNSILDAERSLARGTLKHCGRPMMAWCVGNAKVELKGSAYTITKQAAGTAKIDPLMATFDAVAVMREQKDSRRSTYEDNDLVFV